jgi:glucose/arabinose dehydrogenase
LLRFTPTGDLLVSRPHAGDIVLLRPDGNSDGVSDARHTVIDKLNYPHGMDFFDGWLYIAEHDQVGRIRFDDEQGRTIGTYQPLLTGLTSNGVHWSKTLRLGADGLFYLSQGSTCNVCEEADGRRATIMRFHPDGSRPEIYATGLRNSIGFDWAPWNGELFATDNGRDLLGDDFPPCELNLIKQGQYYGWPYFNGDNVPDPDMGDALPAGLLEPIVPVYKFRAHTAPMGISFFDDNPPPGFARAALVALHGSWNRSEPDGYEVVSLHWSEQGIVEREFLTGFLDDGTVLGRPVDVVHGPEGAVFVSDDYAGAVYRISR